MGSDRARVRRAGSRQSVHRRRVDRPVPRHRRYRAFGRRLLRRRRRIPHPLPSAGRRAVGVRDAFDRSLARRHHRDGARRTAEGPAITGRCTLSTGFTSGTGTARGTCRSAPRPTPGPTRGRSWRRKRCRRWPGRHSEIRMCAFPKWFIFNTDEPPRYPFRRQPDGDWDFTQFEPEYFQHLDRCVAQLGEIGVEADVILFHPYDRWGFAEMPASADDRYVQYVVRRLRPIRMSGGRWPTSTTSSWPRPPTTGTESPRVFALTTMSDTWCPSTTACGSSTTRGPG